MIDLQSKTDEELNVMLAECIGWRTDKRNWESDGQRYRSPVGQPPGTAIMWDVPRYCSSLDEVAKVEQERIISPFSDESNDYMKGAEANYARLERYEAALADQVPDMGKLWAATARQRTIALIAALQPSPHDAPRTETHP